jgi:hypothetical protein
LITINLGFGCDEFELLNNLERKYLSALVLLKLLVKIIIPEKIRLIWQSGAISLNRVLDRKVGLYLI